MLAVERAEAAKDRRRVRRLRRQNRQLTRHQFSVPGREETTRQSPAINSDRLESPHYLVVSEALTAREASRLARSSG